MLILSMQILGLPAQGKFVSS